jgi:uncharacterized OsmC-like protein
MATNRSSPKPVQVYVNSLAGCLGLAAERDATRRMDPLWTYWITTLDKHAKAMSAQAGVARV